MVSGVVKMPEENVFDVIVVGGGPAGSTAAFLLCQQGLNVLIIDKDAFPRTKLCGGLLTYKTLKILKRIYGDTLETLQAKDVVDYITYSYELRTPNSLLQSGVTEFSTILVDRWVYDSYLIERASSAGAKLVYEERILNVDLDARCVTTATGKMFKAKIIIGADGANSVVRRYFPRNVYNLSDWTENLATGLEVTIPRDNATTKITGPVVYFGVVPWGYGWIFPNKENLVVGVGCLSPRNVDLRGSLEVVLSFIAKEDVLRKPLGHPIPYGNFMKSPAHLSTLLVGDAAGLVDPLMGEGIYYAHRSAEIAAKCIQDALLIGRENELANMYIHALRKSIIPELIAIKRFRWLIFKASELFGSNSLNFITHIVGIQRFSELVHGVRSYQWLKKGGIDENR